MKIVDMTYLVSWAALWVGAVLSLGALGAGILLHVAR